VGESACVAPGFAEDAIERLERERAARLALLSAKDPPPSRYAETNIAFQAT
jgi:hypothetical protein